jgi:hypothetical protein
VSGFHLRRGEVLRASFRYAEAAAAFAQAARTAADPAPALDALVACAEEAQQTVNALAARRERAELAAKRGDADAGPRLLEAAERLGAANDADGARACLERLLALVPPPELARAARRQLARIASAQGDLRSALAHTRALAELSAGRDRAVLLREAAQLALSLDEPEAAREALLGALALSPRDEELVKSLAGVQQRLGDAEGEAESLATLADAPSASSAERARLWLRAASLLTGLHAVARA